MCSPLGVYTFQVLLQSYLHSPTICYGMVAQDLLLFSFLTSVKWGHYIDDIMLICEDLPLLQKTFQALLDHLQRRRWAVSMQKIPGLGAAVKSFGVVWLGKTCVVPEAVIDEVQAYPIPNNVNEVQPFVRILGYWWTFILHLAHILCPLYRLYMRLRSQTTSCLWESKILVQQIQALRISQASLPFNSGILITPEGMCKNCKRSQCPLDFGPNCGREQKSDTPW